MIEKLNNLIVNGRKKGYESIDWEDGISLNLDFEERELVIISKDKMRTYKIPKKESNLTPDWILKKISDFDVSHYKSLSNEMKKLNLNYGRVYPTSYGLGYTLVGQDIKEFEKEAKMIADFLEQKGYKFKNEFSEKGWVYRFKVRKTQHERLY